MEIVKVLKNHFPTLLERLESLTDPRARRDYSMAEIVMAAIALFLFKEGSRNALNNELKQEGFLGNYQRLFGVRAPHMDTVEKVMRLLNPDELEELKAKQIQALINKKAFPKFEALKGKHLAVIDATGVQHFDHKHCEQCLHSASSAGVTSYFHNVLEAKLVSSNGMAVSLASEWIANDAEAPYDKQDCELKASKRLVAKMRVLFPRLPIVIAADGLYPNEPFMQLCHDHECNFILTLKDGNLPDLQEEIALQTASNLHHAKQDRCSLLCPPEQQYRWINNLFHNDITIHWLECRPFQTPADKGEENKPETRYTFITDLEVNEQNADKLCAAGRTRWKIENEGFNTQKNGGYELAHKYSRVSFVATQNYYLCLQTAHLINQFAERSATVAKLVKNKFTLRHIWEKILRPALAWRLLNGAEVQALQNRASQIRVYT